MSWLAALAGLLGFAAASPPLAGTPPNVVVIIADDLGSGQLSSYSPSSLPTPNVDALAREGVRLTRFYVAAPICTPSRAGLLTGRDPSRYALGGALGPKSPGGLPATEKTLAEILAARGYATAYVGKWHLGTQPAFFPTRRGFKEFYGLLYGHAQSPVVLYRNETPIEAPTQGPDSQALVDTLTQRYTQEAIRFIEGARQKPFLLVLGHSAVHTPPVVSAEFRGRSGRGSGADSLLELDWSVGQISSTLDRLGLRERTIVVFVSDNGSAVNDANGLRGGKWTVFEGGIRVPFVVRWPGRLPAGRVETRPAIAYDLLPTLARWTGAELPSYPLDGYDISEMLAGRAARANEEFLWSRRAYTSGRWKLHIAKASASLYDLETDPSEATDVAAAHPDVVARLKAAMADREASYKAEQPRAPRGRKIQRKQP